MNFVDMHNHALWGIDDGPGTREQMHRMLDDAYASGTRVICFTPHFNPGMFPADDEARAAAYEQARSYAREKYPDLRLHLACELRYSRSWSRWFPQSRFGCLDGNARVLVDFSAGESAEAILYGLHDLMNHGYRPVLAHAERYSKLSVDQLRQLKQEDVILQADAQSFFGGFGLSVRLRADKLLRRELIDLVSSDAHDCGSRPVDLSRCWQYIRRKMGSDWADALCAEHALQLLSISGKDPITYG